MSLHWGDCVLGQLHGAVGKLLGWGSALTMDCTGLQTVIDCQGPKHNR